MKIEMSIERIDAGKAAHWLDAYKTKAQRRMSPARVRTISHLMTTGKWLSYSEIHLGCLDGNQHLIDGQHTLAAIARTGIPQWVRLTRWAFASYAEMVERAVALNDNKRHSILDILETLYDHSLDRHEISQVKGAFVFIDNAFDGSNSIPLPVERIEKMIHEYDREAEMYFEAVRSAKQPIKNSIRWGVIVALGLVTFKDSADVQKVNEFWEGVAHGINPAPGDPRGMAYDFLATHILRTSQGTENGKKFCSHQKAARYIARCFTAWAKGETISRISVDESRPIHIHGTRFKG